MGMNISWEVARFRHVNESQLGTGSVLQIAYAFKTER